MLADPETANVVDSAQKAQYLLGDLRSARLKIILDPANLFGPDNLCCQDSVLENAFDLLAPDIDHGPRQGSHPGTWRGPPRRSRQRIAGLSAIPLTAAKQCNNTSRHLCAQQVRPVLRGSSRRIPRLDTLRLLRCNTVVSQKDMLPLPAGGPSANRC